MGDGPGTMKQNSIKENLLLIKEENQCMYLQYVDNNYHFPQNYFMFWSRESYPTRKNNELLIQNIFSSWMKLKYIAEENYLRKALLPFNWTHSGMGEQLH